jgi:hypothetical protein
MGHPQIREATRSFSLVVIPAEAEYSNSVLPAGRCDCVILRVTSAQRDQMRVCSMQHVKPISWIDSARNKEDTREPCWKSCTVSRPETA